MLVILLLFLNIYYNKSLIIPIKTFIPKFNDSNIIPYYTSRQFYSIIELGTPKQNSILLISLKENSFYLDKMDKKLEIIELTSLYNYSKSSSCQFLSDFTQSYGKFYKGAFLSDNFYFYENLKDSKKIYKNISFFTSSKNNIDLYFSAGIGLQKNSKDKGFIEILKDLDYIKTYDWFLNYTKNKKDGNEEIILVIGQKPHDYYPQYYSENQILSMNSYCSVTYLKWGILFNKIYINEHPFNDLLDSEINFNYDSLIIPNDYWDYISQIYFSEYINLNICSIVMNSDKMRYFYCDKNKFEEGDINKAPSIYFYSVQFKYTFEIKGKDLFELKNNKYYFLLLSETFTYSWTLGKPFFKKYPFLYNIEERTISFYNPNIPYKNAFDNFDNKINQKYYLIIFILGLFLISIIIFGFFILRKNHRQRKIRSNEIEDEFVYKPQNNINKLIS